MKTIEDHQCNSCFEFCESVECEAVAGFAQFTCPFCGEQVIVMEN